MLIALMGLSAENERTQKEALFKALATIGNRRSIIQSAKWCPAEMPFCFGFAIFFNHLLCSSSCCWAFCTFFCVCSKRSFEKSNFTRKKAKRENRKSVIYLHLHFLRNQIINCLACWARSFATLKMVR